MRRLILLVVLVASVLAGPAGATSMLGEQRVLVVLVTWGPEPFAVDEVQRVVFTEADAFMRNASYGRASLAGDVTPWLRALGARPECNPRLISRAGREAAAAAGYRIAGYTRFVFIFPRIDCPFAGLGTGEEAFLNGALWRMLVAHELGHTYGLPHANTWECGGGRCDVREYGNPYSVMGNGDGHYTAWEKNFLGWLPNVASPVPGPLELFRLETPATGAQALKVTTASSEYWFEYRGDTLDTAGGTHPGGVLVNAGANPWSPLDAIPLFGSYNLLLPDPAGRGRPALGAGEAFAEGGSFRVTVEEADGVRARLRFAWADTTAPVVPQLPAPQVAGRFLEVGWPEAAERGSGVERYEVSLDGRPPTVLRTELSAPTNVFLPKPPRGRHVVALRAIDRAGNRSELRSRAFRVG